MGASPYRLSLAGGKPAGLPAGKRNEPRGSFVYPSATINPEGVEGEGTTGRFYGVIAAMRLDLPEAGKAIKHWHIVCRKSNVTIVPIDDMVGKAGSYGEGARYAAHYQVSGMFADVMACMNHSCVASHTPIVSGSAPREAIGSGPDCDRGLREIRKARELSHIRKVSKIPEAEERLAYLFDKAEAGRLTQEMAQEMADIMVFLDEESKVKKMKSGGTGKARKMRAGKALSRFEALRRTLA